MLVDFSPRAVLNRVMLQWMFASLFSLGGFSYAFPPPVSVLFSKVDSADDRWIFSFENEPHQLTVRVLTSTGQPSPRWPTFQSPTPLKIPQLDRLRISDLLVENGKFFILILKNETTFPSVEIREFNDAGVAAAADERSLRAQEYDIQKMLAEEFSQELKFEKIEPMRMTRDREGNFSVHMRFFGEYTEHEYTPAVESESDLYGRSYDAAATHRQLFAAVLHFYERGGIAMEISDVRKVSGSGVCAQFGR